jgi:hypothetical protein
VAGLDDWQECRLRAVHEATSSGIKYFGLSDEDMLRCQLALAEPERKADRIRVLQIAIQQRGQSGER